MIISKELKNAISHLSSEEKDKLIFRLLRKDEGLANRLHFELVSNKTVEQQCGELKKHLSVAVEQATKHYYSSGYFNMSVRYMSGDINNFVSITKDKYGEISLNLYVLNETLQRNRKNIMAATPQRAQKFCMAVIARAFKIMLLLKKMHEDYWIEFRDDLKKWGTLIGNTPYLMKAAINNGLDVNRLLSGEIPNDIAQIHKNARQLVFLR